MPALKDFINLVKDYVYMAALVAGAFFAIGFTVDPPWASAQEVKEIKEQMQDVAKQQNETSVITLETQKIVLQAQLLDAEKELRDNPNSRAAYLLVLKLKAQIEKIDRALAGSPHP